MKKKICKVDSINKKVNTVSTSAKFEESIWAVLYVYNGVKVNTCIILHHFLNR